MTRDIIVRKVKFSAVVADSHVSSAAEFYGRVTVDGPKSQICHHDLRVDSTIS